MSSQPIYRTIYSPPAHGLSSVTDHAMGMLEKAVAVFPFEIISSLIFLGELQFYFTHAMQLPRSMALTFILLSGSGCVCSAMLILTRPKLLRSLQAISSFIGNASFMYLAPYIS